MWWGRTEFSVSFDSLSYNQVNHFGDRVSAAATCVVHDGAKLDIAIAPQVTICCAATRACAPAPLPSHATTWGAAARE